jgi:hypothetical protein
MCSVGFVSPFAPASDDDPFDLIEAQIVAPPVIELRRPGAGMIGHCGGFLQRAAVLEICCDAGRPETVVADLGLDHGRLDALANHLIGVGLRQRTANELARAATDGAKERPFEVCREPVPVPIGPEGLLQIVVTGRGVVLATLFMRPYPESSVLSEHVLDLHSQGSPDADEAINHERDARAIAQSCRRRGVDTVEQPARFCGLQY